tara:strand:- start:744 stop:1028 length:285 start_codon:yes stop_codon:yes gene_type:complete
MRFLKALVIGMGVLIVVGVVAIIVAAIDQAGGGKPPAAFAPVAIVLPAGADIVETRVGDGRIVVRLKLPDGGARLMIVDPDTGRLTGTVDLKAP